MKPAIDSVDSLRATILGRAASLGLTDGASEEETIERVLEREVQIPEPTEDECRRHYEQNSRQYTAGEIIECDHILFAVAPGVPVAALRSRAEAMLLELRADDSGFAASARQWSNCPSSQLGGNLGQLTADNSAPEFFKAVSEHTAEHTCTGVMPTLVRSRHGFHIVRIRHRVPGSLPPFDALKERIAASLVQRATVRALAQYVAMLSADGPGLVQ